MTVGGERSNSAAVPPLLAGDWEPTRIPTNAGQPPSHEMGFSSEPSNVHLTASRPPPPAVEAPESPLCHILSRGRLKSREPNSKSRVPKGGAPSVNPGETALRIHAGTSSSHPDWSRPRGNMKNPRATAASISGGDNASIASDLPTTNTLGRRRRDLSNNFLMAIRLRIPRVFPKIQRGPNNLGLSSLTLVLLALISSFTCIDGLRCYTTKVSRVSFFYGNNECLIAFAGRIKEQQRRVWIEHWLCQDLHRLGGDAHEEAGKDHGDMHTQLFLKTLLRTNTML